MLFIGEDGFNGASSRERCGYFKQLGQLHLYTPAAEM